MSDGAPLPPPPPRPPAPPAMAYVPVVQVAPQRTNGFAIASMVLGILWIWWIGSILAVIFGHVAISQINRSNGKESGSGMAIAGLVLGYIGLATLALFFLGGGTSNWD